MKKITLLFMFFNAVFSYSQGKIGIAVGTNYSYFTDGFGGQILAENSFGVQLGIVYEKKLLSKLSFRPKLLFSQQGDRTQTINYQNFEINQIDTELNYINIPLDLKLGKKIYVIAGPQVGFLISDKKIGDFIQNPNSNFDYGINLGTGFTIYKLFLEVGIYQGLSSVYEYKYFYTGNTVNANNGHLKFTIGFMLN